MSWDALRYQAMKRHDYVHKANMKMLHIAWFQLYDILEKANYSDSKKVDPRDHGEEEIIKSIEVFIAATELFCMV